MKVFAHLAALSISTLALSATAAGCAADPSAASDVDVAVAGDGNTNEQDLISEHQLVGNELPPHTVALSFDDGPGERTIELTEYLAAQGLPATFFINGMRVPGRQAAIDAVVNRGFLLGNHTQNHLQLTNLGAGQLASEVALTDAIITAAQPDGPFLFRAPFGAMNQSVVTNMNSGPAKKYSGSIFWDTGGELTAHSAADWACWGKHLSVQQCGALYLEEIRARGKGIILMHDIHNPTIDMVKTVIVPALKAEGWHFAKMTDVPSVKRSLANVSAPPPPANACSSATLGRSVAENTCVQSRSNTKWFVCFGGDWIGITGSIDPRCTGDKFPLP